MISWNEKKIGDRIGRSLLHFRVRIRNCNKNFTYHGVATPKGKYLKIPGLTERRENAKGASKAHFQLNKPENRVERLSFLLAMNRLTFYLSLNFALIATMIKFIGMGMKTKLCSLLPATVKSIFVQM